LNSLNHATGVKRYLFNDHVNGFLTLTRACSDNSCCYDADAGLCCIRQKSHLTQVAFQILL